MKQCPICGRDVLSKRKDAVFCQNAACRKKAHQARLRQPAPLPSPPHTDKAAAELTFPDGSRWRVELTPLAIIQPKNRSGTDPSPLDDVAVGVAPTSTPSPGSPSSPDQIPQTSQDSAVGATSTAPSTTASPVDAAVTGTAATPVPSGDLSSASPSVTPGLLAAATPPALPTPASPPHCTVELFFTDEYGARMPFSEAVHRRWQGYRLRPYAAAQLGMRLRDGYGLGGTPGQFRTHYPDRSLRDLGFDDDIAVLYADESTDQAHAPDVELLQTALGTDWRTRLRTFVMEQKHKYKST